MEARQSRTKMIHKTSIKFPSSNATKTKFIAASKDELEALMYASSRNLLVVRWSDHKS